MIVGEHEFAFAKAKESAINCKDSVEEGVYITPTLRALHLAQMVDPWNIRFVTRGGPLSIWQACPVWWRMVIEQWPPPPTALPHVHLAMYF